MPAKKKHRTTTKYQQVIRRERQNPTNCKETTPLKKRILQEHRCATQSTILSIAIQRDRFEEA